MRRFGSLYITATVYGVASISSRYTSRSESKHVQTSKPEPFDVAVIGGGVVGLAVARACAIQTGAKVVIIEREDVVGAATSSRNSGLGCTGYDAPIGSLERQLLRRSIRLHQNLYRSFGLSSEHVRKCGSLVVAWTAEEARKLPDILNEQREAGDLEAVLLTPEELREMEPSLSHQALGAVFCPHEAVVEPWLVPMGYAESARLNGVEIQTGREVTGAAFDAGSGYWTVTAAHSSRQSVSRSAPGKMHVSPPLTTPVEDKEEDGSTTILARVVINCAGLYGDRIEKLIAGESIADETHTGHLNDQTMVGTNGGSARFTITPRKGQFLVYRLSDCDSDRAYTSNVIIEPVATPYTKGVIVWRTLYGNVIVGPTATDVSSLEDYASDIETMSRLQVYGEKVLPCLKNATMIGSYTGLRPATEHRDYQIYASTSPEGARWISVGGIRSTGLTASSGIGEYTAELYANLVSPNAVPTHASQGPEPEQQKSNMSYLWRYLFTTQSPGKKDKFSAGSDGLIGVSQSAANPLPLSEINRPLLSRQVVAKTCMNNSSIPPLSELAGSFTPLIDSDETYMGGYVQLYGRQQRVTHAISSFGMETMNHKNEELVTDTPTTGVFDIFKTFKR